MRPVIRPCRPVAHCRVSPSATVSDSNMAVSPYGPAWPYGTWAFPLSVLLGGFLFVRSGVETSTGNKDAYRQSDRAWGGGENEEDEVEEEEEEEEERQASGWQKTSSSAHQTDQEADQTQHSFTGGKPRCKHKSLLTAIEARSSTTAACAGQVAGPSGDEATSCGRAVATSTFSGASSIKRAAVDAERAVGRSHLDYVNDRADRWRLKREALRMRVQQQIQTELAKRNNEAARALASVVGADDEGNMGGRTTSRYPGLQDWGLIV